MLLLCYLAEVFWPQSGGMDYGKNFDSGRCDLIGDNVRKLGCDQFPSVFIRPGLPSKGVLDSNWVSLRMEETTRLAACGLSCRIWVSISAKSNWAFLRQLTFTMRCRFGLQKKYPFHLQAANLTISPLRFFASIRCADCLPEPFCAIQFDA